MLYLIADVIVDTDLNLTQTAGVQIFDITTTAAPRRKSARTPILESYEFIPNKRVVAASPDFQEYLDCCAFVAYSSLKCAGDNARALRVNQNILGQFAKLYNPGFNAETSLDAFLSDEKYALLEYLHCYETDKPFDIGNLSGDPLLTSILSLDYLKPALDIVHENSHTNKLKMTEISGLNSYSSWCQNVLDVYDSQPLVHTDYTIWCSGEDDREFDGDKVSVVRSEHVAEKTPTAEQHLVIASNITEVRVHVCVFQLFTLIIINFSVFIKQLGDKKLFNHRIASAK